MKAFAAVERWDWGNNFGTDPLPTIFSTIEYKVSISGSAPWYPFAKLACDGNTMNSVGDNDVTCHMNFGAMELYQ